MQFPFRWPTDELLPEDFERLDLLFAQAVKSHFPCERVSFVRFEPAAPGSAPPELATAAATGEPVADAAGSGLFLPFANGRETLVVAALTGGRAELYGLLRSRKGLRARHRQLTRELRQLKQWCTDPVTGLLNGGHLREQLQWQLASSRPAPARHLVLIEIYPWARNASQGLRFIAETASQLDSFLGGVAALHHLGNGVFAQLVDADEEQVLAMGNSILRWLQRENVVRGHLGIAAVQEGEEGATVAAQVETLFEQAWQALHVARRRAPHALCTHALLDPRREQPFRKPPPAVAGELRRRWRGVDRFALVLLSRDRKPAGVGWPDQLRAAAGPEAAFLPLSDREAFVWLPGAGRKEVRAWSERLRRKLPSRESCSLGIALFPCADFNKADMPVNARKALRHARFLGPASAAIFDGVSLNISGDHYYEEGDLARAVKEYRRGLVLDGTNVNLLNSLGVAYAQMNRHRLAIPLFEQALAGDPENFMALFNLGYAHLHFGDTLLAVACFERALAKGSDHFDLLLQLGKLYCRAGRYQEAAELLARAEGLDAGGRKTAGQGRVFFYLGLAHTGLGEHRQAVVHLQRAVQYNPRDAEAISLLGELYARQGEGHAIALSLCRQAVALDDSTSESWYRLGFVQWLAGRGEEAVASLQRSLRLDRTRTEALRLLAEIHDQQGRTAKARQVRARLLRLQPGGKQARPGRGVRPEHQKRSATSVRQSAK